MRLHLVRVLVLAGVSLGLAACGGSGGGGHNQPPVSGLDHDCVGEQPERCRWIGVARRHSTVRVNDDSGARRSPACIGELGRDRRWWVGDAYEQPRLTAAGIAANTLDTGHDGGRESRDRHGGGHAVRGRIRSDGDGGRDSQRHSVEPDTVALRGRYGAAHGHREGCGWQRAAGQDRRRGAVQTRKWLPVSPTGAAADLGHRTRGCHCERRRRRKAKSVTLNG